MEKYRKFLKAHDWEETPDIETDQMKKVTPPPLQKPYPEEATLIDLIPPTEFTVGNIPLIEALNYRKSRRGFTKEPLTLEEISFLLWVTQGVHKIHIDQLHGKARTTKRIVPSGGSRHPYVVDRWLMHTCYGLERDQGMPINFFRFRNYPCCNLL